MTLTEADRTTTETVGNLDDFAEGTMKMARVGERRIVVVRTASGIHALDNACPHQGYGLATGALSGDLITCQWHNWKFDVTTGRCEIGEEDVACHLVEVSGNDVIVSVTEPTDQEKLSALWPSLERGLDADYVGQIARDAVRLLDAGATPQQVLMKGLAHGVPREENGPGHAMASAADCLAWSIDREGDERALPLVQGLAGIAEQTRGRAPHQLPDGNGRIDLGEAIEAEAVDAAMSAVVSHIESGLPLDVLRHELIEAASRHHLSYGHGIIYTQKIFELLNNVGAEHAMQLLPHLAARLCWSTREDVLPYMTSTMRLLDDVDLAAVASAGERRLDDWSDPTLVDDLLDAAQPPIERAVAAVHAGAGIEGLLDAVVLGVSRRLLRYDVSIEFDAAEPFGWLDITHGLTTARAARWAWRVDPGPHNARSALWAVWLLFDTGRAERRNRGCDDPVIVAAEADIGDAIRRRDVPTALAAVSAAGPEEAAPQLIDAALADGSGSFIVTAHLIKLTQACIEESTFTGSDLPLLAATRFLAAPRLERFVSRNVAESIDFLRSGRPPKR